MKRLTPLTVLPFFFAFFLIIQPAEAQNKLSYSVFGGGGVMLAGNNRNINGTIGQIIIGSSGNASHMSHAGFWYKGKSIITSIEHIQNDLLPREFRLYQNFPNPFNPATTIRFALPTQSKVTLKIYDLTGKEVANLIDKEMQAGEYNITFEAGSLPSGVYFYRLQAEKFVRTRKFTLIK